MPSARECLLLLAALCCAHAYIEDDVLKLQGVNQVLFEQLKMQQFASEERIRSQGFSGAKQIRITRLGTKPYFSESITRAAPLNTHNHANHFRTVGMGEVTFVINGVEFSTRHNDYAMRLPHRTKAEFNAAEYVSYPDVPPSVYDYSKVGDQITELKEWYKAWAEQDYSKRDYRQYFPAYMCYLEAAWTQSDGETLSEMDESDRHRFTAVNWEEFHRKSAFFAYSGNYDASENTAILPTRIVGLVNGTIPILGQWNYRFLCHKLKEDLPLNRFQLVDDVISRAREAKPLAQYAKRATARFRLCQENVPDCQKAGITDYEFLDEIMSQIPGMNGYSANLTDVLFDEMAMDYKTGQPLNAAYYHRVYKYQSPRSYKTNKRQRSFSDSTVYMALNTIPEIIDSSHEHDCSFADDEVLCNKVAKQKWSYAIPVEIIYLHPLHNYNPYNIDFHGTSDIATAGGRFGGNTDATAYNGSNTKQYFRTPKSFFTGDEVNPDPADTATKPVHVLNKFGVRKECYASGIRAILPELPGIGSLRTRYPIFPIHGEGNFVMKELHVLKDMLENAYTDSKFYPDGNPFSIGLGLMYLPYAVEDVEAGIPKHTHFVKVSVTDLRKLRVERKSVTITTEAGDHGATHKHTITVEYTDDKKFNLKFCDGVSLCHHTGDLTVVIADME